MTPRRRATGLAAAALALLALAPAAHAMGGQDCAPEDLAPVDAWLAKHPWRVGYTQADARVAAACKGSPVDKDVLLVAAAYAQDREWNKNLVVALVDTRRNTVRAAFKGVVVEKEFLRVEQGSLRLDTSRYNLAAGVRAIAVDVSSSVNPTCGDGYPIWYRSLLVQEGDVLRPVLDGLLIESLKIVGGSRCAPSGSADELEPAWTISTIAIAPHATHGFADLAVTESLRRQRGLPQPTGHYDLRYDGTLYRRANGPPIAPLLSPETAATP